MDPRRKVRREILRTINELRDKFDRPNILADAMTNKVADAYADYLLREEENEEILKQICEEHGVVGDYLTVVGLAYLDEDDMPKDKIMMHEHMDAHGLLLELQKEREMLCKDTVSHVAVGFASNQKVVKVVELLCERPMLIN